MAENLTQNPTSLEQIAKEISSRWESSRDSSRMQVEMLTSLITKALLTVQKQGHDAGRLEVLAEWQAETYGQSVAEIAESATQLERERCAKILCKHCRDGAPTLWINTDRLGHETTDGTLYFCSAAILQGDDNAS